MMCRIEEKFLSTPSARRATPHAYTPGLALQISIHALREEGDNRSRRTFPPHSYFYPRPPRGGRPGHTAIVQRRGAISIHALREEGDRLKKVFVRSRARISIHALREEGDFQVFNVAPIILVFLSTPSARRATTRQTLGN